MNRPSVSLLAGLLALTSAVALMAETSPDLSRYQPEPFVKLQHPDWSKNAVIYQINLRQFTPEGTLRAAEAQLPRLQALNVDILWLMPIHEIGVQNRKGGLGSPYSVRDYYSVNHEFGTVDDLKHFVAAAHALGLHVILDWVANHTAWDNVLVQQHPEWYEHDWKGRFRPTPWWDWSDIINLDYRHPGLRHYMTEALKYWVREAGVDGYRCDVAGFVPLDFWNNARRELDAIKPVFMLAEWDMRDLHMQAFDMTYAWKWYDAVHKIAQGQATLDSLFEYFAWQELSFGQDCIRMTFLSNHDMNSWSGTQSEAFGAAAPVAAVLSVVGDGMPLLYNSQEAGETKRLKFFERDPIEWQPHPMADHYRKLFALKHANSALWNGHWGARMLQVPNNHRAEVLSFVRQNDQHRVFAVLNFSAQPQTVRFEDGELFAGSYTDFASGAAAVLKSDLEVTLPAWGWRVFVK